MSDSGAEEEGEAPSDTPTEEQNKSALLRKRFQRKVLKIPTGLRYGIYDRFDSYLTDEMLRKWARSTSIYDINTQMGASTKLRLERLTSVFDYSIVYFNKEAVQLGAGVFFGELALETDKSIRQASIKMKQDTFLAYLDRFDYNMVMKQQIRKKT